MISHRHEIINYSKHANIGLYNANKPNRQILYLDANNLYGYAMMQHLPTFNFKWLPRTMSEREILSLKSNEKYGYILEIDFIIPEERHDKFSNYPLGPERKEVRGHMLSDYQKYILRQQFLDDINQQTNEMVNKKVPGKTKDELNGNALLEFIGLRAKCYAFRRLDYKEDILQEKKLKGIQKCVVKMNLNFEHYKSALYEKKTHIASACSLRSHLHQIQTLAINKVATDPFDDKRYLLDDGISSLPYGHYAIQER